MNPYVNTPEIDEYIKKRTEALPKELSIAVSDDGVYKTVENILNSYRLEADVIEDIKYEVFLILAQILPYDELAVTLVSEYDIEFKDAVSIEKEMHEKVFKNLLPLLKNVPDEETEGSKEKVTDTDTKKDGGSKSEPEVKPGSSLPTAQKPDLKERLRLRPENVTGDTVKNEEGMSRPLTRDELMKSLSATRTMAKDIEAAKGSPEPKGEQQTQSRSEAATRAPENNK